MNTYFKMMVRHELTKKKNLTVIYLKKFASIPQFN